MNVVVRWVIPICWVTFGVVWLVGAFTAKPPAHEQPQWRRWWFGFALVVLFVLLIRRPSGQMNVLLWSVSPHVAVTADLVAAIGLAVAMWARVALGRYWSGNVVLKEAHVIIDDGPYRLIRHPIYLGVLLMLLGTALWWGRLAGLVLFVVALGGFRVKAGFEERLLADRFPTAYASYKARVKRVLVPWIW